MTNILLYIIYGLVTVIGLTTILNGLIINVLYFVFRYRNTESLKSFLGGFVLWWLLSYLWKIISKTQMPQLAIVMCIIGLIISLKATIKVTGDDENDTITKTISSQIITLVIIFIASFFMYKKTIWY